MQIRYEEYYLVFIMKSFCAMAWVVTCNVLASVIYTLIPNNKQLIYVTLIIAIAIVSNSLSMNTSDRFMLLRLSR